MATAKKPPAKRPAAKESAAKKSAVKAPKVSFATVRAIARLLPGVEESTSYGAPALKVKGKLFARLKEDGETLVVKVALEARDALVAARPGAFFVTDHYRAYPFMLVRLATVERAELAQLLEDAWSMTAPSARERRAAAGR